MDEKSRFTWDCPRVCRTSDWPKFSTPLAAERADRSQVGSHAAGGPQPWILLGLRHPELQVILSEGTAHMGTGRDDHRVIVEQLLVPILTIALGPESFGLENPYHIRGRRSGAGDCHTGERGPSYNRDYGSAARDCISRDSPQGCSPIWQ